MYPIIIHKCMQTLTHTYTNVYRYVGPGVYISVCVRVCYKINDMNDIHFLYMPTYFVILIKLILLVFFINVTIIIMYANYNIIIDFFLRRAQRGIEFFEHAYNNILYCE